MLLSLALLEWQKEILMSPEGFLKRGPNGDENCYDAATNRKMLLYHCNLTCTVEKIEDQDRITPF